MDYGRIEKIVMRNSRFEYVFILLLWESNKYGPRMSSVFRTEYKRVI